MDRLRAIGFAGQQSFFNGKAMLVSKRDSEAGCAVTLTGNGFGARHDPTGDWLYGYEMVVDPAVRGARIGRRLYEERRALAEERDLTGIAFGGRMPGLARLRRKAPDVQAYLDEVIDSKRHDSVIRFQLANGFHPIGLLPGYLPEDTASHGYAAHMVWRNPSVVATSR